MIVWLLLLFWIAFTALFAHGQGLLIPWFKQVSEGSTMAKKHSFALHGVFVAVWMFPISPWCLIIPWWQVCTMAILVRFAMFDVVLNYAAEYAPFHVGQTAKTDRLLQWIAAKIGVSASVVNAVLKLFSLLFLLVTVLFFA